MALSTQLFFATLLFVLSHVASHSYMTSPISRSNQAQTQSGCRGPQCLGPCDIPLSRTTRAPVVAVRGQSIRVDWPRNNHAGGFVRLAWAPTSLSDSHTAFDAHVQQISCHEIGNPTPGQCAPSDPINDPNGGGSGPGDGSFGACNTNITIPLDLTDGKWTLQWAWFGGAFSLSDYYSCADFTISGGPSGLMTPVFKGGDFSYPNQQKCKFFNTDKLHVCTDEPCQKPIYSGVRAGPPAAGQLGLISSIVPTSPPSQPQSTTAAAASVPVVNIPSSTGRIRSTTGSRLVNVPAPVTVATTSPANVPIPTPSGSTSSHIVSAPSPVPSSPVASNCAGADELSTSTARFVSIDSWGVAFHALVEIDVDESVLEDWVLQVQWPASGLVQVARSFNGGTLQCEEAASSFFKPTASWSNKMPRGSKIQVEFIASLNGLTSDQIQSGTRFRVLKQ